jgi:hypothetical protein
MSLVAWLDARAPYRRADTTTTDDTKLHTLAGVVGAKANNLAKLRSALPDWVRVPASVALPFGVFEAVLGYGPNAAAAAALKQLQAQLASARVSRAALCGLLLLLVARCSRSCVTPASNPCLCACSSSLRRTQVGGGVPPALASARQLVRTELQAPPELIQVRGRTDRASTLALLHSPCISLCLPLPSPLTPRNCCCCWLSHQHPNNHQQELAQVASAAGMPGADSWAQQGSATWPGVWAAITQVRPWDGARGQLRACADELRS